VKISKKLIIYSFSSYIFVFVKLTFIDSLLFSFKIEKSSSIKAGFVLSQQKQVKLLQKSLRNK